ncbi:TPA: hypothetical protein HA265_04960 [Candidatus Woesearchaeota archaeon]|nr:hypothetical protein [Candidatus Woesearchaeota archaeon]
MMQPVEVKPEHSLGSRLDEIAYWAKMNEKFGQPVDPEKLLYLEREAFGGYFRHHPVCEAVAKGQSSFHAHLQPVYDLWQTTYPKASPENVRLVRDCIGELNSVGHEFFFSNIVSPDNIRSLRNSRRGLLYAMGVVLGGLSGLIVYSTGAEPGNIHTAAYASPPAILAMPFIAEFIIGRRNDQQSIDSHLEELRRTADNNALYLQEQYARVFAR